MYAADVVRPVHIDDKTGEYLKNQEMIRMNPSKVKILMKQGTADVANPVVQVGTYVRRGQLIGSGEPGTGVYIYASISGVVSAIEEEILSVHETVKSIVIEGQDTGLPSLGLGNWGIHMGDAAAMERLRHSGIIQLSGDRKPLYAYLMQQAQNPDMDCIRVTAFDMQPCAWAEYRLILECASKIIFGARMLSRLMKIPNVWIYTVSEEIEYILEKTVRIYQNSLSPVAQIRFYRVGDDDYRRNVKTMCRTSSELWCSASDLCAVYDCFYDDDPMTGRWMSVGGFVKNPGNFFVPNGTSVREVLEHCNGICGEKNYLTQEIAGSGRWQVIEGGLLSGKTVDPFSATVSLATDAIFVRPRNGTTPKACIQCMACCKICPSGLKPIRLERLLDNGLLVCETEDLWRCTGCGWCSYVCPSGRALKEKIFAAKKMKAGNTKKEGRAMDAVKGQYIEIPPEAAGFIEDMDIASSAGPFIKSKYDLRWSRLHLLYSLLIVLAGYLFLSGPAVIVNAGICMAVFSGLPIAAAVYKVGKMPAFWDWLEILPPSILLAIALGPKAAPAMVLAASLIAFAAHGLWRINSLLFGVTIVVWVSGITHTERLWQDEGMVIFLGAAFIYLLSQRLVGFWAGAGFLVLYGGLGSILNVFLPGSDGFFPFLFLPAWIGAVYFVNDYKNGGKNTAVQKCTAWITGIVSALLTLLLPPEIAVFTGLFLGNIIACNLNPYTI